MSDVDGVLTTLSRLGIVVVLVGVAAGVFIALVYGGII